MSAPLCTRKRPPFSSLKPSGAVPGMSGTRPWGHSGTGSGDPSRIRHGFLCRARPIPNFVVPSLLGWCTRRQTNARFFLQILTPDRRKNFVSNARQNGCQTEERCTENNWGSITTGTCFRRPSRSVGSSHFPLRPTPRP
jgi:hypothetical protein